MLEKNSQNDVAELLINIKSIKFSFKEPFTLTSGSKRSKDKINLTENPEIVIWGIVTHVIHAL